MRPAARTDARQRILKSALKIFAMLERLSGDEADAPRLEIDEPADMVGDQSAAIRQQRIAKARSGSDA